MEGAQILDGAAEWPHLLCVADFSSSFIRENKSSQV